MTAPALLVIGGVVTDIVALHGKPIVPHTDTAARIAVRPGGSAANTAAWAARAGAKDVRLLSRVGADSAEWHRAELLAAGVRPRLAVDAELATAVVICLVDTAAERTFVTDLGAAGRLGPEDWAPGLLNGVGRVHLSGYLYFTDSGRRLAGLVIAAARAAGVLVSIDPASTGFIQELGVGAFVAALDGADLLLPNLDEARLLTGTDDPVVAAERLSAGCGEAVVDTTGAGDAFAGGFLAARLAGADLAEAAAAGCRAGASATAVVGGRPPR